MLQIVWSLVRRRVTRRLTRLQTMYNVLKLTKNDEIMSKNQFTGSATQPQCNRKFCQFNKDQYCMCAIDKFQLALISNYSYAYLYDTIFNIHSNYKYTCNLDLFGHFYIFSRRLNRNDDDTTT